MPFRSDYRTAVLCRVCDKQVAACLEGQYSYAEDDGTPWETNLLLMRCPECSSPFLVEVGEDVSMQGQGWGEPVVKYPVLHEILDQSVPKTVAASYNEAMECFRGRTYTACSLMCRRTIELLCLDKDAKDHSLAGMLGALKARGVFDERMHQWADFALREGGNDAAHDVNHKTTKDVAKDQLEFCRAIIEHIYVFTAAFDRYQARREASNP